MPDEPQYPPPGPAPEPARPLPPEQAPQPFPQPFHPQQPYAGGWGAPYPGPHVPPPPRRRRTGLVVGLVVAGVAVLGLVVAGVGLAFSSFELETASVTSETSDPWYATDVDGETVELIELAVGDCFFDGPYETDGELTESFDVERVACSDEHPLEVIGAFDLTERPVEDDEFFADLDERCWTMLEEYAGERAWDHDVWITFYWPTKESWFAGDREVVCVGATDELEVGSLAGGGSA
ncbi:septum formation family protein [Nocardioides sp. CPCC 205120]|uniref:septum formation family protein n=1 Tax=Nocardioides sp. CPCC 205120 TaxID=3406462 RepID=UPI003B507B27